MDRGKSLKTMLMDAVRWNTSLPGRRNRSRVRKVNVMVKTVEIVTRNFALGALEAFLEGKKDLKWLLGT
jgi:hypothetical protein